MPRFDVIGIGENSVDDVYRVPALPRPGGQGSKIRIAGHARLFGGQVATTLSACAALGLRASYIGAFGSDAHGTALREALIQQGVDVHDAPVRPGPNRHAVILVGENDGDRIVLWERDPLVSLSMDDVTPSLVTQTRLLHVDGTDEAVSIHAAQLARTAGVPVTSDIDTVTERTPLLLSLVSVPILAEDVARTLTGEDDMERALRRLRRDHPGRLCVTRGARGALMLEGDVLHEAPAFDVHAVDTTGAGDVFRAGFIVAMLRGDAPVTS